MSTKSDHPITPPPELVQQWLNEVDEGNIFGEHLAAQAAQWGADQELEACVKWLNSYMPGKTGDQLLRPFRRPKPPSLKQQALQELNLTEDLEGAELSRTQVDLIRRALEALPND